MFVYSNSRFRQFIFFVNYKYLAAELYPLSYRICFEEDKGSQRSPVRTVRFRQ